MKICSTKLVRPIISPEISAAERRIMDDSIFKAYDIRGTYPEQINEDLFYKIGQAYVEFVQPKGKIAVGRDVRLTSEKLQKVLIQGLTDAGIDVIDIGLVTTEMMYFTVGNYKLAGGIQVTASHNPAEYNGLKMVRGDAEPLSGEEGIYAIRDLVKKNETKVESDKKGVVEEKDVLEDYCRFILKFIDTSLLKPAKLVFNPNFGLSGEVLKKLVEIGHLPLELVGLNEKPDGTFPKGRPDPFVPENRPEFVALVKSSGADLGVAWDADADRVFFCTKSGHFVESYFMNAMLIKYILQKEPGAKIVYEPRFIWALIDSAHKNGGEAVISRVGHTLIKAKMREINAYFCGESSGHTYFRDFWYSDSGMIPLLMVLEIMSQDGDLDVLLKPYYDKYFIPGEVNTEVVDMTGKIAEIKAKYADGKQTELDGISVEYADWRFNVRPSNTEPLLRLCLEAKNKELMEEKQAEVLKLIRE